VVAKIGDRVSAMGVGSSRVSFISERGRQGQAASGDRRRLELSPAPLPAHLTPENLQRIGNLVEFARSLGL
jgi:hypothetical protein